MRITVIASCFNRRKKTISCLESIVQKNKELQIDFIIVDDNSTDDTLQQLKKLPYNIQVIEGGGNLFWAGGMRMGIAAYLSRSTQSDYVLFVNDDVLFFEKSIQRLVEELEATKCDVVVGATCDQNGGWTYGGLKVVKKIFGVTFVPVKITGDNLSCDTFNCNCVIFSNEVIQSVGNFPKIFKHSLADYDYGLRVGEYPFQQVVSAEFVGVCERNSGANTWTDTSLSRFKRVKLKETPKGAPIYPWFFFLRSHFGLFRACVGSITPYLRIVLGR